MPAVDEILTGLADHPPAAPTPVGEIRGRARRRARRRRGLAGVAAAVALVAAGVGVGLAVADDPGDEVVADGGTTTGFNPPSTSSPSSSSSPSSDVPVATEPPTMTLDPASGYVDGTVVAMALDEPTTGPVLVAQCAAEAEALGDGSPDVLPWCTGPIEMQAEALRPFTLTRTLDTPNGVVDCAEAVGRCTLGIRVGGSASTDDRYAPLAFRDDLPEVTEPTALVDGDEGTVGDGDTLLVTLAGVETGDQVHVMQCRPDPALEEGARCSADRTRSVVVQDGPETQLTFTAFHDILVMPATSGLWAPEWTACEPCELRITTTNRSSPIARLPLTMEPTDDPIRPTLTVDPPGPHAPGEVVTLRATGLQPGVTAEIAWCLVLPPEGGGDSPCDDPTLPGSVQAAVGVDGTFVVPGYALPSGPVQGEDCVATPGACGVGIHELGWFAYTTIAPLDLTG